MTPVPRPCLPGRRSTRGKTQKQLLGQLMDQVFDGSAQQLVMQALSSRKSTPEELAQIKKTDQRSGERDQMNSFLDVLADGSA